MRKRLYYYNRCLFFESIIVVCVFILTSTQLHLTAQNKEILFDNFDHGNLYDNGWFLFHNQNESSSIYLNKFEHGFVQHVSWGIPEGEEEYNGGFGRINPIVIEDMTHFTFWINPISGSEYTLEVNLQEDDNFDGEVSIYEDDEFQFDVIVSSIGQGAIVGKGWQKISIPLVDFYDDDSYLRNGNGTFDAVEGNTNLLSIAISIINHGGDKIEFQTKNWAFNNHPIQKNNIADKKVLFVGNSYTFYNNMPRILYKLAESAGKKILVDQSTFPGYWLDNHTSNEHTSYKLQKEDWDYVVIQEQSQVPTVKFWRDTSMKPSAKILDTIIKEKGAETVLFMTWGRQYGGEQLLYDYVSSNFNNYSHMQDSLESVYRELANYLDATLAPVGLAWENALTINQELNLWDEDQSHPTYEGSYLTACVFYTIFFNKSPVGLGFTGNLDAYTASFLQNMASTVLVDKSNNVVSKN